MKKVLSILAILLAMSPIFISCEEESDGSDDSENFEFDGSLAAIRDFYNSDVVAEMQSLGFDINTGDSPPFLEDCYLASPLELTGSSVPNSPPIGTIFEDLNFCLSNQDTSLLTIDFNGTSTNVSYDGDGSYISGSNDRFSIFLKITITAGDGTTAISAYAVSGRLENGNVVDFQSTLIMLDDNGDPSDVFIPENTGQLFGDDVARGDNGSSGLGSVIFWTNQDYGCGPISVTLNGEGNSTITGFYPGSSPDCEDVDAGGVFDELAPGSYSYSANCVDYSWSGNITIEEDSCLSIRLSQ